MRNVDPCIHSQRTSPIDRHTQPKERIVHEVTGAERYAKCIMEATSRGALNKIYTALATEKKVLILYGGSVHY